MSDTAAEKEEIAKWDPSFTKQIADAVGPLIKRWHRAEVRDIDNIPSTGGVLVVSNHSGGMLTPDVFIFSPAFYNAFGYDRPVYTLGHYGIFMGPLDGWLRRLGVIEASRENAAKALHTGAVVLVFPGGDYDSYRPTLSENTIDFNGRTGYVRTAVEAGVPIVPTVSIGGQETQLFLTRGNWLARRLGLTKARMDILPVSFGFPFGLSVIFPPNLPLPAKIVTEVLEPIDVVARFGDDPDIEEVDGPGVRASLEAILLVADEPVPEVLLAQVLERPRGEIDAALRALAAEYTADGRGFDLREIAGGWRFYTREDCAPLVERFVRDGQEVRLTQAALETLAVIAYRQPVSRARVSAVRGVNCDGVIRTLVLRGLVEDSGTDQETGAILYRTTGYFLERLGMASLDELPDLAPFLPENIEDIEDNERTRA